MKREKKLLIVCATILFRFDVETTELPAIGSPFQVVAGKAMGVAPAETGGTRRKAIASLAAGYDHG